MSININNFLIQLILLRMKVLTGHCGLFSAEGNEYVTDWQRGIYVSDFTPPTTLTAAPTFLFAVMDTYFDLLSKLKKGKIWFQTQLNIYHTFKKKVLQLISFMFLWMLYTQIWFSLLRDMLNYCILCFLFLHLRSSPRLDECAFSVKCFEKLLFRRLTFF